MHHLRTAAKNAASATSGLIAASKHASGTCNDPVSTENLKNASKLAAGLELFNCTKSADAISSLVRTLQNAWLHPHDKAMQDALVKQVHESCPQAYKLVAAAKSALPKITDANNKQQLRITADDAADALQVC